MRWMALPIAAVLTICAVPPARANGVERTKSATGAQVYLISPKNGETLTSPVRVRFGLTGMGVAPAGVEVPRTGHHHLIVDTGLPPLDLPIPKDAHHLHFGAGQTETLLELTPGRHTLQLLLGDARHLPHEPPLQSRQISITVR